jgi:hypothetical protein
MAPRTATRPRQLTGRHDTGPHTAATPPGRGAQDPGTEAAAAAVDVELDPDAALGVGPDAPVRARYRVLIVALAGVEAAGVVARIRSKHAAHSEVHVLLPVGRPAASTGAMLRSEHLLDDGPQDVRWVLARYQLDRALGQLEARGVGASGEVTGSRPVRAAGAALAERETDEVILTVAATAWGRWRGRWVASRLGRAHRVAVIVREADRRSS